MYYISNINYQNRLRFFTTPEYIVLLQIVFQNLFPNRNILVNMYSSDTFYLTIQDKKVIRRSICSKYKKNNIDITIDDFCHYIKDKKFFNKIENSSGIYLANNSSIRINKNDISIIYQSKLNFIIQKLTDAEYIIFSASDSATKYICESIDDIVEVIKLTIDTLM